MSLKLEIVTPEKRVFDADVDSVTVPTVSGEAGILPNHAPLISALKPGILTYSIKGSPTRLAVTGGFVEVKADVVSILADSAERSEDIDLDSVRSEREAAEKAVLVVASASMEETEAVREQLEAANVRLQLASGK
jgi:F-type H+-transporting ATPase subunit epsilon